MLYCRLSLKEKANVFSIGVFIATRDKHERRPNLKKDYQILLSNTSYLEKTDSPPSPIGNPKIASGVSAFRKIGTVKPLEIDTEKTHILNDKDKLERSAAYIDWRLRVSDEFRKAGMDDIAEKFEDCASHASKKMPASVSELPDGIATVWVCSDSPEHNNVIFAKTCDCRCCPDCARRQVARLAARYIPHALHLQKHCHNRFNLRHIVLTTPYSLEDDDIGKQYEEKFDAVMSMFDKLLPVGWINEQGIIVSAEFGESGLKLHFHIVHYGQFIEKQKLTDEWEAATDSVCTVNWIESMVGLTDSETENKVIEVLKYSVKFFKTDDDGNPQYIAPELMPKLHMVLKGSRRIRSRGVFFGLGAPDKKAFCCEECGAEMSRCGVEHWIIYRQSGILLDEWKLIKSGRGSLDLKLANKSCKEGGIGVNKEPPKQTEFPNMPRWIQ